MNTKNNKITIRFNDKELDKIKNLASKQDLKVATFIRNIILKSIESNSLLSNEEEIKEFIIKTIEESNDKKLGRIISLLFRATSHIDIVKEQNDLFFKNLKGLQNIDSLNINDYKHYLTEVAEKKIENRDLMNIKRSKSKTDDFEIEK